ncbi:hypothetical protein VTI74DRAFT_10796 [Chaetomium olivicolor]
MPSCLSLSARVPSPTLSAAGDTPVVEVSGVSLSALAAFSERNDERGMPCRIKLVFSPYSAGLVCTCCSLSRANSAAGWRLGREGLIERKGLFRVSITSASTFMLAMGLGVFVQSLDPEVDTKMRLTSAAVFLPLLAQHSPRCGGHHLTLVTASSGPITLLVCPMKGSGKSRNSPMAGPR